MKDLSPFTKPKSFQAHFVHAGEPYSVEVSLPDLSANRRSCWGDWGPMYTVVLEKEQGIQMTYKSTSRSLTSQYTLRPKTIELNSPMFAKVREQHPLCLELEDEPRGLRFLAYFNHDGGIARTEVEVIHPGYELDQLIFPQAQMSA